MYARVSIMFLHIHIEVQVPGAGNKLLDSGSLVNTYSMLSV